MLSLETIVTNDDDNDNKYDDIIITMAMTMIFKIVKINNINEKDNDGNNNSISSSCFH